MAVADATATLACSEWLGRRSSVLKKFGVPPAQAHPARGRFKFGDVRLGEGRYAADIPVGAAGGRGKVTASLIDADIPG